MYVCILCTCLVTMEVRRETWVPESRGVDGNELPRGCLD